MAKAVVRARSPFRWLRFVLLALGIVTVAMVGLMIVAYRLGRETGEDSQAPVAAAEDELFSGQGFDYTQTNEDVPVFRIRAEKSRQDRDGTAHLETVLLEIYRADGQAYRVTSDRAAFNERDKQSRLEGHVVLRGVDELELETRALELRQQGQVLVSSGAVQFSYPPDLEGRATNLRFDRRTDVISLTDGVHVRSSPGSENPVRLDAERIVYQRRDGVVRAVGDVVLSRDHDRLETHYLNLFLDQDRKLESLRARWGVHGYSEEENELGDLVRLEYQGEQLELQPLPGGESGDESVAKRRLTLDGGETEGPAVIRLSDGLGLVRILTGDNLQGQMRGNRLVEVEGTGKPLTLREALDTKEPYTLRQACAHRLTARFLPNGELGNVYLESEVELSDPPLQLTSGSTASLDLASGSLSMDGPAVQLFTDRAEVVAPRFNFVRKTGVLRAQGGVQTTLPERTLSGFGSTPFGQGEGPVRVESDEASWTSDPRAFSFRGSVRAWRDQNLLLADQLRGDEIQRQLAASGNLKTVWLPADNPAEGPIEVTSETMTYFDAERELRYDGKVQVRQAKRTIACTRLQVELGPGSVAERMICDEAVNILDPEAGRRVTGERAVYSLADHKVEVFGDQVQLFDAAKNRLVGRYLIYDLEAGTVQLQSRSPQAAEAGSR